MCEHFVGIVTIIAEQIFITIFTIIYSKSKFIIFILNLIKHFEIANKIL